MCNCVAFINLVHLLVHSLKPGSIIQRWVALLLLLIFTVSATPEPFFHAALAGHEDKAACTEHSETDPHFHQQTFSCHFDQVVVTVPYLLERTGYELSVASHPQRPAPQYRCFYSGQYLAQYESRGPPAA